MKRRGILASKEKSAREAVQVLLRAEAKQILDDAITAADAAIEKAASAVNESAGRLIQDLWRAIARRSLLGGAAPAAFGWGVYAGLYCLAVAENRWIDRRLRREIGQRPDPLVAPDDPAGVYVSLIPRENFAVVKLTMSSDLLHLKLDERRREVLMEGDTDRYRIPAGAVIGCAPECFFHAIDAQRQNELWMVRLVTRTEQGPWELLLSVCHTRCSPMTNARRRLVAEEMCQRVNALRG
jgi:hypothetical protein